MKTDKEYFSAIRDRKATDAGGFYCQSCLTGQPLDDQSSDPRYCLNCYEVLIKEAELQPSKRGWLDWMPRIDKTLPMPIVKRAKTTEKLRTKKDVPTTIFAQPDGEQVKSDGISRGRPAKVLPVRKIKELASQGKKVPDILRELESQGIEVSRRTIYNIISGQRVLV